MTPVTPSVSSRPMRRAVVDGPDVELAAGLADGLDRRGETSRQCAISASQRPAAMWT